MDSAFRNSILSDSKKKEASKLKRYFDIEVLPSDTQPIVESKIKKIAKTMKAPGFRPGKVPIDIVKQSHELEVQSDAINEVINKKYLETIEKQKFQPAGPPEIQPLVDDKNPDEKSDKLVFRAEIELFPEITLPNLSELVVKKAVSKVTEKDIERTIETLQRQKMVYSETEEGASMQDKVSIDFLGKLDGKSFKGGQAQDVSYVLGSGQMIPEFDKLIVGMKKGERKIDTITFPEDYPAKELSGRAVEFDIKVNIVEEGRMPKIDEKFAKEFGIEDGSIEKLEKEVEKNLKREVESRCLSKTNNSALDALLQASEFDIPEVMVKMESNRLAERTKATMKQQGMFAEQTNLPPEIFLERARRRVKLGLLVNKVVEVNQLNPNEEQVSLVVKEMSGVYEDPEAFKNWFLQDPKRRAQAEAIALERNVALWIMDSALVEHEEIDAAELLSDAAKGTEVGA